MPKAVSIFAGSFSDTHPAAVLLGINQQRESGALYLTRDSVFKKIYFRMGLPMLVESSLIREGIIRVLCDEQRIDKTIVFDVVSRAVENERKPEELIVESGLISGHQMQEHLRTNIENRLIEWMCWPDGEYWFEFGEEPPENLRGLVMSYKISAAVWNKMHSGLGVRRLEHALKQDMSSIVKVLRPTQDIQAAMHLKSEEIRLLRMLDGTQTIENLSLTETMEHKRVLALIFVLGMAGVVSISTPIEHEAAPDNKRDAADLEFARRVHQERGQIEERNYFEMLRIGRDFDDEQLRRAYYTLSQRYHEDKLFTRSDPETRQIADSIFQNLTIAFETLGGYKRFRDSGRYVAMMQHHEEFQSSRESRLRSLLPYFDACNAMTIGDSTRALQSIREAIDTYPTESEYHGIKGELSLQTANDKISRKDAISVLKKSLSLDGMCERSLLTIAGAMESDGNLEEAAKYYRRLLRIDSENRSVRRTLRDIMRRRKDSLSFRVDDDQRKVIAELKVEIEDYLKRIENANHFQILNLPMDCDGDQIKNAYFKLAKKFHPDHMRNMPLNREIEPLAEELFMRINQAYQVLISEQTRRLYERSLRVSEQQKAIAAKIRGGTRPEDQFKQALMLVKDRVWDQALEVFNKLTQQDPKNAQYVAYKVYCEFMNQFRSSADGPRTLMRFDEAFREAQALGPDNPDVLFLWGRMYRVFGDLPRARMLFQKALNIDDEHIESLREMRLIKSRIDDEESSSSGLLGKLLYGRPKEESAEGKSTKTESKKEQPDDQTPWYKKKLF
ncbi:MAG: DnaJ domain-containing protein [Candidatus Alcyoniella australis]|nr:DnaJ domain-containing protein [Candidatus Alcyoniella australis]